MATAPKRKYAFSTRTDTITSEVMLVTPELAEEWLGKNSHNRPVRQKRVDDLAAAIKRGEWKMNGDAIRFSKTDVLLDGQHRLWAIVMAEQPVESLVMTGLDDGVQETMDTGARRNLKDALTLRGVTNANKVAATLAYWFRYSTGQVRYVNARPSIAQAIELLDANPGIVEAIKVANRVLDHISGVSAAMLASAYYELSTIDDEAAEEFFARLADGVNLGPHSPILIYRRQLERQLAGGGAKASTVIHHALLIKAWNFWRDGIEIDRLNWKASGMNAENFPEPH